MHKFLKSLLFVVSSGLVLSYVSIVLLQDVLIFPGAIAWRNQAPETAKSVSPELESLSLETSDEESLEVWRLKGRGEVKGVGVVFRGNDGPLRLVYPIQAWLANEGYTTYLFNYRGYGQSTGSPSTTGILTDGRTVIRAALTREKMPVEKLIVAGVSLGSGPAAILAEEFDARAVVLIAGYSSLQTAAKEHPVFWVFAPFLRTEFNTEEAIRKMDSTCLYILHGISDPLFPYKLHAERNQLAYHGKGFCQVRKDEFGSHVVRLELLKELNISACQSPRPDAPTQPLSSPAIPLSGASRGFRSQAVGSASLEIPS